MMTRQKNLWYLMPLPDGGPCILGMFKQPVRKTFVLDRGLIPKHAGYKPDRGINQDLCGHLTIGQDKIADRHFLDPEMIDHPLIHTLETTAKKCDTVAVGKPSGHGLCQGRPPGRQIDDGPFVAPFGRCGGADRAAHDIGAHDHPCTPTRWRVIDIAVASFAKVSQVNRLQRPKPLFQGLARQALAQKARKGIREKRDHPRLPGAGLTGIRRKQFTRLG